MNVVITPRAQAMVEYCQAQMAPYVEREGKAVATPEQIVEVTLEVFIKACALEQEKVDAKAHGQQRPH